MFKPNFTITLGSLLKGSRPSAANVIGAILRMAVAVLIAWWLWDEVSYSGASGQYSWLVSFLQRQITDENVRTCLEQILHGLDYLEHKYGYNLEQIVLVDWLGGRLISNFVENCIRGRIQLQS